MAWPGLVPALPYTPRKMNTEKPPNPSWFGGLFFATMEVLYSM